MAVAPRNLRNENYRFAFDLVNKVMEIRGDPWFYGGHIEGPRNILFTKEHGDVIRDYLINRHAAQEMDLYLEDATIFDLNHLRHLMECIKSRYESNGCTSSQRDGDTDYSALYACSKIAYTACVFRKRRCPNATMEATDFIHMWVLQRPDRFSFTQSGRQQPT